ncbi:MAG: TIGR01777 family protein [Sphingobacteriales bacterium]|nr:MAG: TIGR01777 family protein [Sphingobacteriales bacterium]
MATIGITGGNGFVGKALAAQLRSAGNEVLVFSRSNRPASGLVHWDPARQTINQNALATLDAVIHLAGAGVADKRWTATRKAEIYNSRVSGTQFLVKSLRQHAPNCKALISASAIGYYGETRGGRAFTETDPPATDFLGRTCRDWEAAVQEASDFCRVVMLRTGIVLGQNGGALSKLTASLPFRIVPILGGGQQQVSWIHLNDLVGLYIYALQQENVSGPLNAVAPQPVSHRQLMKTLAQRRGGRYLYIPVPALALKLALGEMSTEVLKSCRVSAAKALDSGYAFSFPDLQDAAQNLMQR